MRGFKSFARKTELMFSDEFSCILGPNGSGKSNILDALCFVLGKSSSKSLRAEKSAHLIYNGGKSKNPAKEAEVIIYFDNAEKEFPVDDNIVKVSRMVKATGQSVYRINDKVRTRQNVVDLLGSTGINPDGYNIILQGDVMRIVEISADERRKIIEDVSGISIYEGKKNKALKELEKVETNLNDSNIILQEKESYIKELKKDRDQALKYKDLESKIAENKATYLDIQIKKKEAKIKVFADKNVKLSDDMKKHSETIEKLSTDLKNKKSEIDSINKEIEEKGEKEQVELNKQVENLRVELATDQARIENCKTQISGIKTRKDELVKNITEIDGRISIFNAEKDGYDKSRKENLRALEKVEANIARIREKSNLDGAFEIEKKVDEIDKQAEVQEREIAGFREKQQNLLREKDKIEFQIDNLEQTIIKVSGIEKEHKHELEQLKHMKQQFKQATLDLNKRINEDSELASQLATARGRLQASMEKLSQLQVKNTSIAETQAGNEAMKRILAKKDQFQVHGTISDLGHVSSKYSLALEIAAGSKLKHIVANDDKSAAECIRYLKQNRLGIATFLPMNRIRAPNESDEAKEIAKSNGVIGRAIDLISFEPKFKKVFMYVFGNTLVVENIDVARRIGVSKIKMVTLDGDLIDISGAMQGGFRKRSAGIGFKEKEVVEELEKYEADVNDLRNVQSSLESKRVNNEDEIARLRQLKATLEGDIIKKERSLHLNDGDLGTTRNEKKELEKKSEEFDEEINKIISQISLKNREFANLKIERQKLKMQISQMRDPKLLAELNTYDQKKQEIKGDLIKLESQISSIETQIATIVGPEKEKTAVIIKQLDKEEEAFNKEIDSLNKLITDKNTDLKTKEEKQKEFYAQFKDLFARKNKLNDEVNSDDKEISVLNEKIRELERRLNVNNLEIAKVKAEMSGLVEEFKDYADVKLNDKPEDQLKREINQFNKMVEDMGNVNLKALEVYDKIQEEYQNLLEKKETLLKEKNDVLVLMNEIESKKKAMFMETYNEISDNFEKIFSKVSHKGDAVLELDNPESPFDGGLRIKVKISGRKFMDIRSLSGGEKTMTALAFIFAILEYEPAPFYILDEVDAALDKRNSDKLSKLIRAYADQAQYIMISHNDGIISEADTLYGISMNEDGISKAISLKI